MSDELNPHDLVLSKRPLGDELERLGCDATTSHPTIEPIERPRSTGGELELNPYLTSAFIRGWERHRESGKASRPPFRATLDPLPSLIFCNPLSHHRVPRYVRILAGPGDGCSVTYPERTQSNLISDERRIGWREITHSLIVAATWADRSALQCHHSAGALQRLCSGTLNVNRPPAATVPPVR